MMLGLGWPAQGSAHCDTLKGPVVSDARTALDKGDVTPALKWVQKGDEAEILAAFKSAVAVRAKGKEAKALADQWFFETLVRVHRAGEDAPYTGLKDSPVEAAIQEADKALDEGKADGLIAALNALASKGVRERFERALDTRKHRNESVAAGREAVDAYVEFTHYVEGVHAALEGAAAHHGHAGTEAEGSKGHTGEAGHE
jgi:hypothetical protein